MAIVYILIFLDGSFYIGKTKYNSLKSRYGSTKESYLNRAANDDVYVRVKRYGKPEYKIVKQSEDYTVIDAEEERLIRLYIGTEGCLNKRLIFTPLSHLSGDNTSETSYTKQVFDLLVKGLSVAEIIEVTNIKRKTVKSILRNSKSQIYYLNMIRSIEDETLRKDRYNTFTTILKNISPNKYYKKISRKKYSMARKHHISMKKEIKNNMGDCKDIIRKINKNIEITENERKILKEYFL